MSYTKKGDNVTKAELNTICQKTYEYKTKNGSYPAYTTFNNIQIMKEELYDALVRNGNYNASHTTEATDIRVGDAVVIPTPEPTPTDPDAGLIKFCPTEILERGSHDYCVGFLEKRLKQYGFYNGIIDNDFGPVLKQAVIDFQNATGHTADGVVGPKTWPDVLNYVPTVTPTPSGEFAEYLQATANCQVNDSRIQAKAKELQGYERIFYYVKDDFNYDLYYNTEKGAVGTYTAKIGNCCDLSHLLVAILRAAGFLTRYCHSSSVQFSSGRYGHVWCETYAGGRWVRLDTSNNGNEIGVNPADNQILATVNRYKELPF